MPPIRVEPIGTSKRELKPFLKFAWEIYRGNPYWVPPLVGDKIKFIRNGSYAEVGKIQPFVARRDGRIVGRLIAHFDRRHNEYFNEKRGCVGFFESINDPEVSRALFADAEQWLAGQGLDQVHGPMNFLLYDESGLLADDYEAVPPIELGYNPPYYHDLFLDHGFEKTRDWYAYRFTAEMAEKVPPLIRQVRDKALNNKEGITFRIVDDKNHFNEEMARIKKVFNRAWEKNWGHYPLTDGQIAFFGNELKPILKSELVWLAECQGEPVGLALSIPDVNPALKRANGRLFPFGLVKILLGLRKIRRIKVFMMGVLPEYRLKGIEVVFYLGLMENAVKLGYTEADCSLIVEDNIEMINGLRHLGAERYKTYRFYAKPISVA